ncbi:MAG TPA: LysR family transcriptional regulator [Crocinitomicaceae bacterium]|nr:LysR family transcriptional regulator [Crocinitomicaceae bacterium]
MISIQQIQYILALNEEKQFQRASELCFVTQPTLSMQIKKAEETLGAPIFDRSRNPLELTAFGKELLPVFQDVISEYNKISRTVAKKEGVFREEIRMAIIPTISAYMLPDLYAQWKEVLPNVQLSIEELKTEEILLALENRKIDIGILAGPVSNSKWRTIPLFQEEIKAFFPSAKKKEVNIEELMNEHPWLLTSGNCLRTQMMHFCELKSSDAKDEWDYEGGSIDLLEKMVEQHGGYTLVPEYFIQKDKNGYKRINSSVGEIPAREVIALIPNKSAKWEYLEILVRKIQLEYGTKSKQKLSILSWK